MTAVAVSNFMESLFLILVATPFILLWGAAILDVIRRHYSGWAIVGWLLLILVLPIIGPLIYFATRRPTAEDVEKSYLGAKEMQGAGGRNIGASQIRPS